MLFLDALDDAERLLTRTSTRSVSDRAKIRFEFQQFGQGLVEQGAIPFLSPGGEEFEGYGRLTGSRLLSVDVANEFHVRSMVGAGRFFNCSLKERRSWRQCGRNQAQQGRCAWSGGINTEAAATVSSGHAANGVTVRPLSSGRTAMRTRARARRRACDWRPPEAPFGAARRRRFRPGSWDCRIHRRPWLLHCCRHGRAR